MPAWEDLDPFFDVSDFAEEMVFFTPQGERSIAGIFDAPFINPRTGAYQEETREVMFTCSEQEAPVRLIDRGTKARTNLINYVVTRNKPDGTGVTLITLAVSRHE